MENLTPKIIAQQFYLDDIIVHEIILSSYSILEEDLKRHPIPWERSDLIFKLCNLALSHGLVRVFQIDKNRLMNVIQNEYKSEISHLHSLSKSFN